MTATRSHWTWHLKFPHPTTGEPFSAGGETYADADATAASILPGIVADTEQRLGVSGIANSALNYSAQRTH
ncbi:hypothetical protein KQY30_20055 [Streptomyces sp. GMY02]|uniref:hypothetical protein n=1 Tax=Streptomyces sp. GMY02 TaxID=1333528 RepID=UPI001C2BB91E|nr:hypothetical protein [Streptomyces sp. GMY02]QXE36194.1 hypothetical protein KQY30_20055 [Streptomyces sp. GMY02]